ncbi:MAG: outer membrane beta-barrel protein [Acidobacteriaceae bacterium]|nr:outer membrane beta-barrel protein [Acidobacteriaceae bacterium]
MQVLPFSGRRFLAIAAFVGSSFAMMHAQTSTAPAAVQSAAATNRTLDLAVPKTASADEATFSSSSEQNEVAVAENKFDFAGSMNAMQYGGRSRYGRPRYRGGNTNSDGSNKYEFFGGAGFTKPVGNTQSYYNPSWSFQVGAGRNFNKHFGVNVEFNWDNLGLTGKTLYNQAYVYDPDGSQGIYQQNVLDGYAHVWSFSVDPTYYIPVHEGLGAYITGGVGFYHKTTTFTLPGTGVYCDPYYGFCYQYVANQPIDSYTSNAPGFNGGIGFTYKMSHFSNTRLYTEIRYVVTLNSQRYGITPATVNQETDYTTNFFPANSNRTTYLPVKFGVRF